MAGVLETDPVGDLGDGAGVLFQQLRGHIEALAGQTDTVGCVVVGGAGRSFCAGNDLKAIGSGEQALPPDYQETTIDLLAVGFIGARLLYAGFYIANFTLLRTFSWLVGMVFVVSLFVQAA